MIGKLVVDYDEVSLGDLLKLLTDKGVECCVDGDNIYVYEPNLGKQYAISNIMRKKKIQNYFFKELTSPPTRTPINYVQTWLLEKFNELEMIKFNEQNQALLKKAQDNINKAKAEFTRLVEQYNQQNKEAQSDGGSNN